MFQIALTDEQYANLYQGSDILGDATAGLLHAVAGWHPRVGGWTSVSDMSCGYVVLSESPIPDCVRYGHCVLSAVSD